MRLFRYITFVFLCLFIFFSLCVYFFYHLGTKKTYINYVEIPPDKGGYYLLKVEGKFFNLTKVDYIILKIYIRCFYKNKKLKYGKYVIKDYLSPFDLIDYLYHSYPSFEKITIYPGDNLFKIASSLEKKNICSKKDFLKYAFDKNFLETLTGKKINSLEGLIKPDTYTFSLYEDPKKVIKYFYKFFEKNLFVFLNSHSKLKNYLNLTFQNSIENLTDSQFKKLYSLFIIASLMQKETSNYTEMHLISSVIHNRLYMHMPLQLDPTYFYQKEFDKYFNGTYFNNTKVNNTKILFDTYKMYGLPKTPICSFDYKILLPAAFPKKTNYLFFVRKNKFSHIFSSSYKEHLENIKKYYRKVKNF